MNQRAWRVAAVVLLASSGAWAQGYVGGAIGRSHVSFDSDVCSFFDTCDKSGTGWKLFGGYRFHPNVAAELSYFDYGKFSGTYTETGEGVFRARGTLEATGWGLGVAGSVDFTPQWVGVARVGLARMKSHERYVETVDGVVDYTASCSKTATRPYFGLGVGYRVSPALSVDAAVDFSKVKLCGGIADGGPEALDATAKLRLLSLGVTYRF